ncbi:sugar phosphate isomerase/epimerase family protein [Paenibacillus dendritiformis]|uniref:sugar phosphate isomerase/epimerase family protein n=1 Tax=Paenibacillus dendritiformis TaxID=130049 RepID=UPI00248B5972|nr:sugar phosphate isomerase/epimerase family protein [Paenibacillus dendritiformis]WGU94334.1 sugar phosphate isomerase/epimerase family protein [Paenibacillus dendritiformis]
MKLGVSIYSLHAALQDKRMTVLDVLDWMKAQGADHAEIVDMDLDLANHPERVDAIRQKAAEIGLELSNYCIGANFAGLDDEAFAKEVARVKSHVDVAHRLRVKRMRHDVAWRSYPETDVSYFEQDFPALVEACRQIADYAAGFGITTSVENHGFYIQASERVKRLVLAVDRENFRTTMDVGNFTCADENSLNAVRNNIGLASMVHLKDFYIRSADRNPGEGWFRSLHGNYLRGAIVGQGDLPMYDIIRAVKEAGYDGYVSIEFEGMEDCLRGTKIGIENARRIWSEV